MPMYCPCSGRPTLDLSRTSVQTVAESGSVLKASWPQTGEVDGWMSRSFQFLSKTLKAFRITAQKVSKVSVWRVFALMSQRMRECTHVQLRGSCCRRWHLWCSVFSRGGRRGRGLPSNSCRRFDPSPSKIGDDTKRVFPELVVSHGAMVDAPQSEVKRSWEGALSRL